MSDLKNWTLGITASLAVSSIGVALNTYVDVQMIKQDQEQQKMYLQRQDDSIKQMNHILTALDKNTALQAQTLETLQKTVDVLQQPNKKGK